MSGLDPLILDFLEWLRREPRSYADVMDAWRTSCPRLTIWEDAIDRGLAGRVTVGKTRLIEVTPDGEAFLAAARLVGPSTDVGRSAQAAI